MRRTRGGLVKEIIGESFDLLGERGKANGRGWAGKVAVHLVRKGLNLWRVFHDVIELAKLLHESEEL